MKVVKGSLMEQSVEAIVNPWNHNLVPWYLISNNEVIKEVKKVAGEELLSGLKKEGYLDFGSIIVTNGGKSNYKNILHIVCSDSTGHTTEEVIRKCIKNLIQMAESMNLKSLAMPLIGSILGDMIQSESKRIIVEELNNLNTEIEVFLILTK